MSLETLITAMQQKAKFAPPLGAKIAFHVEDLGTILFDGTQMPAQIGESAEGENAICDTSFKLSENTLNALMNGTQDPTMAYMTGKVKIAGKMGIAMKMASFLGD